MKTVVLGGGVSGLTAAYALNRIHHTPCVLYEKEPTVGGLCRTLEHDGFVFDSVSHVLHFRSKRSEHLARAVLDGNLMRHERNACIFLRGRYIPYPFQTHLGFLPFLEKTSCLVGYLRAWVKHLLGKSTSPANFEEWIHSHFGAGIAETFMVPYNTKLWGVSPQAMSFDWVGTFVPGLSLSQVFASLFRKTSNGLGYNSHFFYPQRGGIELLADGIAMLVSEIRLGHRVVAIDLHRRVVRFEPAHEETYDRLISTIPLRSLIQMASGVPQELRDLSRELRSTTLLNFTYCINHPLPHSFHWVYFSEPEFPFFRLVFPSNFSSSLAPPGCSIISAEVSVHDPGRSSKLDHEIRLKLQELGLLQSPSDIIHSESNYFEHAYPVHDLGRESRVARLHAFLNSTGVWSIGRFGGWRYTSIDDAMDEAYQTAETIVLSQASPAPCQKPLVPRASQEKDIGAGR